MNTVQELIARSFQARPLEQKLQIKQLGPHQPEINLQQTTQERRKMSKRTFSNAWYTKADWLTGCPIKNSLFCFPCLLFGGDFSWTRQGMVDLKHIAEKIKKHALTRNHMENLTRLGMLGEDALIEQQINDAYRKSVQKHNEAVDKNRQILSKIIDCICFCDAFELALQGHDESETSSKPGIFQRLVDLMATIDKDLETHFVRATVFKGTSNTIQNELFDCMLEIIRSHIVQELRNTDFVAIQADDTTDVATKTQSVLVFRYLDSDRNVVDRFYGFTHLRNSSAATITEAILCQLNLIFPDLPQKQKLIAQSYDGASVMSGSLGGVQKRIRDVYPNAHFVHCYAHQLNLIMQQAVSKIRETRVFFQDIGGIAAFFTRSPKRTETLHDIVDKSIPRGSSTRWNFHIRTVNLIFEHREGREKCFVTIGAREDFDHTSQNEAHGFIRTLQDKEFQFLLFLFHEIMRDVDALYDQLQRKYIDTVSMKATTSTFVQKIKKVRDGVDDLESKLPEHSTFANRKQNITSLVRIGKEICDIVIVQAQEHFSFTKHLVSATLLQSKEFAQYDESFPEHALNQAVEAYPMLKKEQLRTELTELYGMPVYQKATSALTLLSLIRKLHMENSLTETVTLLKIVITTPLTTVEAERCFSALKRIKTFLRNTMLEERLNALAMLSVESKLVQKIPDFNMKVIDKFATLKDRRADLVYKK
ncbi:zinc finger MYM-type protein 1-like [Lissotriton helveticus]